MAEASKHPITTHVLDQTSGLPAKNLRVTLTLFEALGEAQRPCSWEAKTSSTDGRISTWPLQDGERDLPNFINAVKEANQDLVKGRLVFHTGEYWGVDKTFYPEVVVTFTVNLKDDRQHWHVPVLLGPFGYTTYRGS